MHWFLCFKMALLMLALPVGKLYCLHSIHSHFCNCRLCARFPASQGEGRAPHLSCVFLPHASLWFGWLVFRSQQLNCFSCVGLCPAATSYTLYLMGVSCGLGPLGLQHLFNSFSTTNEGFSKPGNLYTFDYLAAGSMLF